MYKIKQTIKKVNEWSIILATFQPSAILNSVMTEQIGRTQTIR